jgi:hypothetical protein
MVVQMQPVVQGGGSLLVAGVDPDVGPLGQQGPVEPLDLAVGLGPIGSGALMVAPLAARAAPNRPLV